MDSVNLGVVRETFGKVVYTHKTYEKAAEICFQNGKNIKFANVILLSLTSGSAIGSIFSGQVLIIVSSILATLALLSSVYQLNTNYESLGQEYKQVASELWFIREKYQNFIADIMGGVIDPEQICHNRDELLLELNSILKSAPPTNSKAYLMARSSLKFNEEMTFSDDEIDIFLPCNLRIANK